MRVLILANNDIGLFNFRKELIEKFLELKYEVFISLPYGQRVDDLIKLGCKYIDTAIDRRGTNPIKDLGLIIKYNSILKSIKPDIVLTYTIKPNIYGGMVCRFKNISYICNITGLGSTAEHGGILQNIIIKLYKIALKKVKCCFIQNKENLEFIIKKEIVDNKKCRLIPGSGVNLEKYKILQYPTENEIIRFLFIR